jgi:hypothetical protein
MLNEIVTRSNQECVISYPIRNSFLYYQSINNNVGSNRETYNSVSWAAKVIKSFGFSIPIDKDPSLFDFYLDATSAPQSSNLGFFNNVAGGIHTIKNTLHTSSLDENLLNANTANLRKNFC